MTPSDRYPPASWAVDEVRDALSAPDGEADLPTYDDAAQWRELADDPLLADRVDAILRAAESVRGDPVPPLPATRYADYERTGTRIEYERAYYERHQRLALATVAECFERDGAYLDEVLDVAWAICEQTTWVLPAHLPDEERRDGLPSPADPTDHHVALFSARTAHLLAEVDHLLGDRLHPALRERIRSEVDERVITPFEARDDFHWRRPPAGNWNAVCHAAVVLAALTLEDDRDRLAKLVVKAATGLEQYVESFGSDGCSAEGLSYWNFGFGHYAMLAAALEARTGGRLSLLTPPILSEIVRFPLRIQLSPGRHVPFSDSRERDDVDPHLACWAGDAFDVPALVAAGRRSLAATDGPFSQRLSDGLPETVRDLWWCHRATTDAASGKPPRRHFFDDAEWWIARADPSDPDGLVVAAKAGHNGEPHNHNDCGSFVVHRRRESTLSDVEFGRYDRDYFGDNRYEYLVARSLGHSVPYVNGHEQAAGEEFAARVVDRAAEADRERFAFDLADCYPSAAGLSSLRRSIELDRAADAVRVADAADFESDVADPELQSVFVSFFPIEEAADGLAVDGDRTRTRLSFDPSPERLRVERLEDAVEPSAVDEPDGDPRDVWRARVVPPVAAGGESVELRTTISPEPRD